MYIYNHIFAIYLSNNITISQLILTSPPIAPELAQRQPRQPRRKAVALAPGDDALHKSHGCLVVAAQDFAIKI